MNLLKLVGLENFLTDILGIKVDVVPKEDIRPELREYLSRGCLSMRRNFKIYIKDILQNIEQIERFVKDMGFEEFFQDEKTLLQLLAGMRDKLIHFYFGVNPEKVWKVIKEDIPTIKFFLIKILKDV